MIHNVYGGFNEGMRKFEDNSPTIRTPKGGGHLPMVVQPILTPDKEKNRAEGRRMKEDGEEMFTLTGQDIHGIIIRELSPYQGDKVTQTDEIHPTLPASEGNKLKGIGIQDSQMKIRRLTPVECERLQDFPDNWTKWGINEKGQKMEMSDTQRYKMCGNAVTVSVIEAIVKRLL
jgi:DNA (cytosine-5)-methyltransferase 1